MVRSLTCGSQGWGEEVASERGCHWACVRAPPSRLHTPGFAPTMRARFPGLHSLWAGSHTAPEKLAATRAPCLQPPSGQSKGPGCPPTNLTQPSSTGILGLRFPHRGLALKMSWAPQKELDNFAHQNRRQL